MSTNQTIEQTKIEEIKELCGFLGLKGMNEIRDFTDEIIKEMVELNIQ